MAFHLEEFESLDAGLRRIAREQLGIVIRDLNDAAMPDAKKVHGYRARCKKMRGLLRLAQPVMCDAFHREDVRFRDAGRRLCELRDAQVRAETIARMGGTPEAEPLPPSLSANAEAFACAEREMHDALASIDVWPLNVTGFYDVTPGLARTYAKGRRAWKKARGAPTDERCHRLRKWAKYLWYHTRILERMNKPVLRKRRKRLHFIHEALGQAHDIVVLEEHLGKSGDDELLSEAGKQKEDLYAAALKKADKVYAIAAGRYAAEMTTWWADWRV